MGKQSVLRELIRKIYIGFLKLKLRNSKKAVFLKGSDISKLTNIGMGCTVGGIVLNSTLEGGNTVYGDINDSYVGFGSFISPYSTLEFTRVGRYTSIGRYVHVVRGQHPIEGFVSTSPCFYSLAKQAGFTYVSTQKFDDYKYATDSENGKYAVEIGSDVWIGSNVSILEGVRIGDGAVVAAGAVVNRDVEPYTVVGGVPAKVIKHRFTDDERKCLLEIKWWNKDEQWIKEHADEFENVKKFIDKYK